jgi:hypothetical protein
VKSKYEVLPGNAESSQDSSAEPLIGVGSWPGAACSYLLRGAEQSPSLSVTVWAPAVHGPSGPSGPFEPSVPLDPSGTAAERAAQYRLICSQLDQPGLTVSLLSTLNPGLAMPVADGVASLRRHAAAAELLASATATVTPPELSNVGTLEELLDGYGVPTQILALANADRPLNSLLAAGQPLAAVAGPTEPDTPSSVTVPSDSSSLAEVASLLGVPAQRLLEDNRGLQLAADASWVLPGVVALPADAALSRPLAVLAGDAPLTAAEVQAQHGCPSDVFAAVNATVLGVLEPGVELSAGATSVTTGQHDTLTSVLRRLAEAGVRHTVAELLATYPSAPLFRAGARVLLPPPPVTLTASGQLVGTFAAPAFELAVTLRLAHPAAADASPDDVSPAAVAARQAEPAADADAKPTPAPPAPAQQADSAVPAPTRDAAAFEAFIDACLAAVPSIRLATVRHAAAEPTSAEQPGTEQPGTKDALWAVAFGNQGITSVRLQPPAGYSDARFFTPRLLHTDPLHLVASISELTELGTLKQPARQEFHDVDAELWAGRFLADLDRYLDAPFATLLSDKAPDALLAARDDLAEVLAAGAAVVLPPDLPDPTPAGAGGSAEDAWLPSARAALAAACRNSSAGGYGSVAVQHSVVAVTGFGKGGTPTARLGGIVRASGATRPSTTELSQHGGWSTFALETSPQDISRHGVGARVAVDCHQVFDSLTIDSPTAAEDGRVELSFVRPLSGGYLPKDVQADLGTLELPLAQRLRPAPPSLPNTSAEPTWADPGQPTLSQAAAWTLAVSYSHEHAAQDEVRLSICRPAVPDTALADPVLPDTALADTVLPDTVPADVQPGSPAAGSPGTALAGALAGYLAVADQLSAMLNWHTKPPRGRDAATARQVRTDATATLVTLVRTVAEAWAGHYEAPPAAGVSPAETGDADPSPAEPGGAGCPAYRLRAVYSLTAEGERQLERLVVAKDPVTADQAAAGQPGGDWPVIRGETGGAPEAWTPGPALDGQRSYTPARPAPASQLLTLRLEWPGLSVVHQQRARAEITVARNPVLREGVRTCPEFVLTRPAHTGPEVRPANTWTQDIALSGASVGQALQTCFDTLFGPQPPFDPRSNASGRVSVGVRYSYLLTSPGPDGPGLRTELSVAFAPEVPLNADLADNLAREIEDWRRHVEPPATGAEWHFGLTVLSPRAGEPPLLTLDRLVFAIPAAG